MISFKRYFEIIQESPTGIKYGNKHLSMDEAAITFITSPDDFYAFQTISTAVPKVLHINDEFKVVETPELTKDIDEMYHEQLGAMFGLSLGMSTENQYVRGRLWIDPMDNTRILVSLWSFKEEFGEYVRFFEGVVKKMLPKASEFVYEYAYVSQRGIDFAKNKDGQNGPVSELEKLKKKRSDLISQWHVTPSGIDRNRLAVQITDINKKLGIKDTPWDYKKVETTVERTPSWKSRDGD